MNKITGQQSLRCWKRTGVWGQETPRCPKLAEVFHCRNCEVFIQAGRSLLEREIPEGYSEEWSKVLAVEKEEERFDTISVLIFRIGGEWLALPTKLFAEIIPLQPAHSLPHRNNPVLIGVVNVHGEIHLCVSLMKLLGLPAERREEDHEQMMVVNRDGEQWVFPVDEIHRVYRLHPNALQNAPVTVSKCTSAYTKGIFKWKDKSVAFLDADLLLYQLTRSVL
ncbi:MAG: purine-binding chemotaxis protein CheW [Gammaproteobacteria bacterium]|nr:purine-binding chemotaxis protein CheW [Gammaproteobacteria bacterium]